MRETGFYWVQMRWKDLGGIDVWETSVAEWRGSFWLAIGSDVDWFEEEVRVISARLEAPASPIESCPPRDGPPSV